MKQKSTISLLKLTAAAILTLPCITLAATIASDSFEGYNLSALNGQGGGAVNGWGGNWEPAIGNPRVEVIDAADKPMTYAVPGGDIINGASRALEVQLTGAATSQLFARRQLGTPLSSTFYVGYLLRYQSDPTRSFTDWAGGNNTFTLHLLTNSTSTSTLNFGLRGGLVAGTTNDFMVRFLTGGPVAGAFTGGHIVTNTDYYLVLRVQHDGSEFSSATMWLNPAADSESTKPEGDAALSGFACGPITHVGWREAVLDPDDTLRVDALKLGTTFNDVVPLPSTPAVPQVRVETAADGSGTVVPAQNITAGNSLTMYSITRDAGGNFLSNSPAVWLVMNPTDGVVAGDLVAAADGKSAVFTARRTGTANVRTAANATVLVDSGTLTVVAGPAATVSVETMPDGSGTVVPAQNLPASTTVTGYAITRDVGGNFLANVAGTWSMPIRTSGVALDDLAVASDRLSATFTGELSGTATLRAEFGGLTTADSGLLTVSRAVNWTGGLAGNAWDFNTANWSDFGGPTRFYDQDDVTFDATGSMTPAVNLTAQVSPHSINVTAGSYTFAGSGGIGGSSSLGVSSGTRLTLLTTNSYSGPTAIVLGSELQLGNGTQNGSLGSGNVTVNTGGTSPIFNRNDTPEAPYFVSNTISGSVDFTMDIVSGAVELRSPGANNRAKAIVRRGATLILSSRGTDIGAGTALGGFGATNLIIEAGATCKLGIPNTAGDHITAAGRYVYIDGVLDANGSSEAFGVLLGNGTLDNTGGSNAVFTINQGSADVGNGGIGHGGEVYTFGGSIRNTGPAKLGITKDGTNTLILTSANTYAGDTRVISGGLLQLGNANAMQNSVYDQQTADTGVLGFGNLSAATLGGLKSGVRKSLPLENSSGGAVALTLGGNSQTNTYAGELSGPGSLTKTGSGTQILSGTNTYSGTTTISQGTLLVNGALSGSGPVNVAGAGTIGGTGFINGAVAVSGTLSPGNNNIGKLTVNNTVALAGTIVMEITRSGSAGSDTLMATAITLGGTLIVTNIGGALQPGDTFQLFSGTLSGTVTVGALPALPAGQTWDLASINTLGRISVVGSAAPPSISGVVSSGSALVFSGTGGMPGATYYVISTNDVSAPLVTWPRISTNTFGADGKFTNSFPIHLSVPQVFFGIQVP